MQNKELWTIVGVTLVVAIIVSIPTVSITGGTIFVQKRITGIEVYTKAEIDAKLNSILALIDTNQTTGKIQEAYIVRATNFLTTSGVNKTTIEYWKNGAWVTAKNDAKVGDTIYINNLEFTLGSIDKDDKTVMLRNGGRGGFLILNDNVKFDGDSDASFVAFYAN